MDLSTLATAFFTAWTLLTPQRDVQAYQANKQLPPIEQPRSGKFRMEGTLQAGPEGGSFRGDGAFAQPDRLRLAFQVAGSGANEQFEMVVIGTTSYVRMGRGEWQVQDLPNQLPSGRGTGTPPRPGEIPPEVAAVATEIERSFQFIGLESTLDGAPAEHYRGTLDVLALAEQIAPEGRALRQDIETFTMTMDFWVGQRDRYVRRIELSMVARAARPLPRQPSELSASFAADLFDLNQPADIAVPFGQEPPARPTATPTPARPPVQAPVQLPARAPARLPNTGAAVPPLLPAGAALLLLGVGFGLRRPWRG